MSISPKHPPFFQGRHRRTVSVRTLDSVLVGAVCNSPSSRPPSASSQSSFSTAYTTLETDQCFRYYLPHISTEEKGVYTRNNSYACNLSPTVLFQSLPPLDFGRFFHYMPDQSTEEDDVYTDGVNVMYDTMRGHGKLHIRPEQKMVGDVKLYIDYLAPSANVRAPLELLGPKDFSDWPQIRVTEAIDVDADSYAAGERFGSAAAVHAAGRRKGKLTTEKHRRSMTLGDVSYKVTEMLRKLHLRK